MPRARQSEARRPVVARRSRTEHEIWFVAMGMPVSRRSWRWAASTFVRPMWAIFPWARRVVRWVRLWMYVSSV